MTAPEAIAPGAPAKAGNIPLCVPEIRGNEWRYVQECLDTGWVSSVGSYVDRFERIVADSVGARFGIATVNGTSALHVALQLVGVERDDEVLVSSLTFIAPANAIRYLGAWPIFIDAEPQFWQMDPRGVREFLEHGCERRGDVLVNRSTGRRVRAIVPVHVLGHPVDMDALLALARKYQLPVVEDATESLGSRYRDRATGHLGDIACFSFNGNKLITTGGGGMIVTDDEQLARRARYLTTQAKNDPIEYEHHEVGYNFRLTNVLAALGVAQMEQLEEFVDAKRRIAARYADALRDVPGITPMREASWAHSVFWMYTVLIDRQAFGMDSREVLRALAAAGIQARPLWQPLHRSLAHADAPPRECPVADRLNRDALSLPCSVGLTEAEQQTVIDRIVALSAR